MGRRLLYLDSMRGFYAMIIIIAHAFCHLIFWDYNLLTLDEFPVWLIILLGPIVLLATCAPVFLLISSTALAYKFRQKMSAIDEEVASASNSVLGHKDIHTEFRNSIVGFLLLFLVSFIHVSLFHYGMHWNGTIQRTLITGSLELNKFHWTDTQVLFQTDAIGLIAFNGLVCLGLLALLWRNNGHLKPKRNIAILIGLSVAWYAFAPMLHNWLDPIFFTEIDNAHYLRAVLLKFIIGPPQSPFPNFAYGFLGLIMGFGFAERRNKGFFRKLSFGLGGLCITGAAIYMIFDGLDLNASFFGSFLPLEIQVFDIGYILLLNGVFIEIFEFQPETKKGKRIKHSKWLNRFGSTTMTIYIMESFLCVLNLKWYMPLWDAIPAFPASRFVQLFVFVGMQVAIWVVGTKYWQKANYKFSFEWFVYILKKRLTKYSSAKLSLAEMEAQYRAS